MITIGAYDARTFTYADFSGRGPADENTFWETAKPDLVAPGVAVRSVATGGGYAEYTGTSFAVPFVTGSAALLMEWGIIKDNDPYLYGEKVKAYLRRGARELPGFAEYPNNPVSYTHLGRSMYIKSSIEEMKNRKRELGWTNQKLADQAGIPVGTLNKIFSGMTRYPRDKTMNAQMCIRDSLYGARLRL